MMHLRFGVMLALLGGAISAAAAQECRQLSQTSTNPIIVELFTSQGCSSCPPADTFFGEELVDAQNVIGLSMHVDYWDYIGWKDSFSHRRFSERQRAYALRSRMPLVYTPQIAVGGRLFFAGTDRQHILRAIRAQQAERRDAPSLAVTFAQPRNALSPLIISLTAAQLRTADPYHVVLVGYSIKGHRVSIGAGENDGHDLTYHNVVDAMTTLGSWNGRGEFRHAELVHHCEPDRKSTILVHQGYLGPIVAAYSLEGTWVNATIE